jgi:hypothetical protein
MDIGRGGSGHTRFASFFDLPNARLVRKTANCGDPHAIIYVVAVSSADQAVTIIKNKAANPSDIVQDLGRITGPLVQALNLVQGEFMRVDNQYRPLPTE